MRHGMFLAVGAALCWGAAASALTCTANTQCRGDAEAMCAPSSLRIEVGQHGLWIDHQGPYPAQLRAEADARLWQLGAFGGGYQLRVRADGTFEYLGNRGKRFTGTCLP